MDNHKDVKNIVGTDWGRTPNDSITITGIRGKAVYLAQGTAGAFTLNDGLPKSCIFDASMCRDGFTMMLWLWYKHKRDGVGQVFFSSGGDQRRGLRIYQVINNTPKVWFI